MSASVLGRAPPPASLATTALLQLQEVPGSTPEAAGAAPADPASCALAAAVAVTASGHGAAATAAAASFYTQNTPELDAAVALSQLAHSATTLPPPGSAAAAAGGAASLPPRQPLSSGGVHT